VTKRPQPKSFIFAAGQESNHLNYNEDQNPAVKPPQIQHHKKERTGARYEETQGPAADMLPLSGYLAKPLSRKELKTAPPHIIQIDACIKILQKSSVADALLREAAREGWRIGIGDLWGHDFHIDVPERYILLDDNNFSSEDIYSEDGQWYQHKMILSCIRALRDVWQEKRYADYTLDYAPESVLMLERVRAADCDVIAVLCAWEIRAAGYDFLWSFIENAEEADIAGAFAVALQRSDRKTDMAFGPEYLRAMRHAFRAWYYNEARVTSCDHETLEYLDNAICEREDSMDPAQRANTLKKVAPAALELISCLPDKTAYLLGEGRNILMDPLFAGLNDPINQSHFMQIMREYQTITVQGVAFRDGELAARIFPGGQMTPEFEEQPKRS
jgi:hypothetical protein